MSGSEKKDLLMAKAKLVALLVLLGTVKSKTLNAEDPKTRPELPALQEAWRRTVNLQEGIKGKGEAALALKATYKDCATLLNQSIEIGETDIYSICDVEEVVSVLIMAFNRVIRESEEEDGK